MSGPGVLVRSELNALVRGLRAQEHELLAEGLREHAAGSAYLAERAETALRDLDDMERRIDARGAA